MPLITVNSEPPKPTTFEDLGYVQVVRCKDCRWGDWSRNGKGEEMVLCYNGDTGIEDGYLHEPDWFCAEGERREDT